MIMPISSAFKVTCAFIFAFATSGFIPATAFAIKPISSPANASQQRNAKANKLDAPSENTSYDQPLAVSSGDIVTTPSTVSSKSEQSQPSSTTEPYPMPKINNPSGNNGFIKVNEEEMPDSTPNNDPHVSCKVNVEFYNYDKNPAYRADVSFELQSPTARGGQTMTVIGDTNPFIGEDAAGGGNDLDAVRSYQLSFTGAPHAKQGYHVKLTVRADGSRGADVKQKVFWVKPCEQPGQVLPVTTTTTTPGKTLSTSTVTASSALPTSLPSTGLNQLSILGTIFATVLTYFSAMLLQIHRLRRS